MTYVDGLLSSLTRVKKARSLRASSWDTTGRNNDAWIEPHAPFGILPIAQRKPVLKDESGAWQIEASAQTPSAELVLNDEMKQMKSKIIKNL